MKIHEYQGKAIFQVLECLFKMDMFSKLENAESTIKQVQKDFKTEDVVIKAQIHAGGRGEGGGVKYCRNFEEVGKCKANIWDELVTHRREKMDN